MEKQKPIQTFRRGTVDAAIWENRSEKGTFYRVTFSRYYPGPDGKPRNSDSFGLRELASVSLLALQAEAWVRDAMKASAIAAEVAEEVGNE